MNDEAAETSADQDEFVAEFRRWREVRGLSRTALGKLMGYHRSYVSKVESGDEPGSADFAYAADSALNSGGTLRRAWRGRYTDASPVAKRPEPEPQLATEAHGELVVDHDQADLVYDHGVYRATMRRRLVNQGSQPVTRYLIRISVDRYPDDPQRSNQLYRDDPLTWDELGLRAWYGPDRDEELRWTVQHDRDAFKEVWLLLSGEAGHFPLYPGRTAWIEYSYTVPVAKWGNWFRRAVRLPTRTLSVSLDFPTALEPTVWGLHTSLAAESLPFPTAIADHHSGDRTRYSWSTDNPPLHSRYKLEWHFRHDPHTTPVADARPGEVMSALGIVQDGDPALRREATHLNLPEEADDAQRVVAEMHAAADRVATAHTFGKGMGLAAPQIGIDRAAALVRPPDGGEAIVLFNPRVIETSADTDEQYEGCLSFFDVRCRIPRPLAIHVEHQDLDGTRRITRFDRGLGRLVAHEVDHLYGILCRDHLPDGREPTPVEQYRGTGSGWHYPASTREQPHGSAIDES
ncbi:peptide deformylase [Saccharopolyspora sp. NPDC049426]|uniref:peptide deformylase n=1 Tax=Saccharopolyspora sp. NPDC049426 TaxID=3155652 RepID=UPI00341513E0